MIRPSREEFHALAASHTVVPVWLEVLADLETPVSAYAKLVGDSTGFLLESVEHGGEWLCRAEYPELPDCAAEALSAVEAFERVERERLRVLRALWERGASIPVPAGMIS